MYNSDTELIFPARVIPELRSLRSPAWQELVDQVSSRPEADPDQLAFVLLMVKLGGCATCQADSFRALRGCAQCANQTIRRFRGTDQELKDQFAAARKEVDRYLDRHSEHTKNKR